jgi:hypothetical protein
LSHRDATLDQETADLIDYAGPLAHKARADAMESEQVHLFRRLDRHKVHGRPLHRFRVSPGIEGGVEGTPLNIIKRRLQSSKKGRRRCDGSAPLPPVARN